MDELKPCPGCRSEEVLAMHDFVCCEDCGYKVTGKGSLQESFIESARREWDAIPRGESNV